MFLVMHFDDPIHNGEYHSPNIFILSHRHEDITSCHEKKCEQSYFKTKIVNGWYGYRLIVFKRRVKTKRKLILVTKNSFTYSFSSRKWKSQDLSSKSKSTSRITNKQLWKIVICLKKIKNYTVVLSLSGDIKCLLQKPPHSKRSVFLFYFWFSSAWPWTHQVPIL